MSLAPELEDDGPEDRPSMAECAAIAALHTEFFPRLVRLCTRQLRDRALAEDVAQETMLRALRSWHWYDASRPSWPWLRVIALHLCVDAHRARRRELCTSDLPDHAEPSDRTEAVLDEMSLRRAMDGLPERQRLALRLRYLDDCDRAEAARALGLGLNAFDQLLSRARLKMAFEMGSTRFGLALGALWHPLRQLRHRLPSRGRGGLSSAALGTMAALPFVIAPLVIAAGTAVFAPGQGTISEQVLTRSQAYTEPTPETPAPRSRAEAAHGVTGAAGGEALKVASSVGPASTHASLSKTPLAPGRAEEDGVSVTTPFTTISAGGATENSPGPGLLCKFGSLTCNR